MARSKGTCVDLCIHPSLNTMLFHTRSYTIYLQLGIGKRGRDASCQGFVYRIHNVNFMPVKIIHNKHIYLLWFQVLNSSAFISGGIINLDLELGAFSNGLCQMNGQSRAKGSVAVGNLILDIQLTQQPLHHVCLMFYLGFSIVDVDSTNIKIAGIKHDLVNIVLKRDQVQDDIASNLAFFKGDSPVQMKVSGDNVRGVCETAGIFDGHGECVCKRKKHVYAVVGRAKNERDFKLQSEHSRNLGCIFYLPRPSIPSPPPSYCQGQAISANLNFH